MIAEEEEEEDTGQENVESDEKVDPTKRQIGSETLLSSKKLHVKFANQPLSSSE